MKNYFDTLIFYWKRNKIKEKDSVLIRKELGKDTYKYRNKKESKQDINSICKKRYMKRNFCKNKSSILLCIFLIIYYLLLPIETNANENLGLYAYAYALTDGVTGRVLEGEDENVPMANASTTKILTCIVTLEHGNLEDMVTVSKNAVTQPKVRLGMTEGNTYPLLDLLYGLMLESYNDCAVAIAEHIAGSVEAFAELLNQKAKEIGCKDTYFITPNGLDAEDEHGFHHTTASDLCQMMAYCVWESPQKDMFLQITQARTYNGSDTSGENTYSFSNKNSFLDQMDGVVSGKTGYTAKAGYCYVSAFEKDGEKFCISLLACGWPNHKNYKWHDAKILFNHGIETYSNTKIEAHEIKKEMLIEGYAKEPIFGKINDKMYVNAVAEVEELDVLLKENEMIETEIILYTDTPLPIEEGQEIGKYQMYLEDMLLVSIPLKAETKCDVWGFGEILQVILEQFLLF